MSEGYILDREDRSQVCLVKSTLGQKDDLRPPPNAWRCSSGIEPPFAVSFVRNVLSGTRLFETNPLFERVLRDRGPRLRGACELKCKGITVYRDGSKPGQVLSVDGNAESGDDAHGAFTCAETQYSGGGMGGICDF
jgi:ribonucleotide reductase alpha subunit